MLTKRLTNKLAGKFWITAIALVCVVTGVGIGGAVQHQRSQAKLAPTSENSFAAAAPIATSRGIPDFTALAKKVGPAVVNVSTTQIRKTAQEAPSPFADDDPMSQFWQRFFGQPVPRGPQKQVGIGSGFIVDQDGTIVTNYHVVDGANKITVRLSDGREFDAEVLGTDQQTDIAVIKIKAPQNLPVALLGNSDQLEVGEWVMAVGNPFGLDHTVTSGIVSAKGRHIGAGPYDDFIQTDASINPGNSGGPLVNMRGEVVGINTAIFSESGGNIGIGFAIPANLVKDLLPQLRSQGRVVRGYIGTIIQRITPEIADSLGLKQSSGALVADVVKGGPAERAGIKTGDVIIAFDGKEVKDSAELPFQVARVSPGISVPVKIRRNGKELALLLTVGEMKEKEVVAKSEEDDLGLTVHPVNSNVAEELGLDHPEGVVVTSVKPGSAADDAGLERGDVITEINRSPIRNMSDYNRALVRMEKGKSVLFHVHRGTASLFLATKR